MLLPARDKMISDLVMFDLESPLANDTLYHILRRGFVGYDNMSDSDILDQWEEIQTYKGDQL